MSPNQQSYGRKKITVFTILFIYFNSSIYFQYEVLNNLYSLDYSTKFYEYDNEKQKSELVKMMKDFYECYANIKDTNVEKAHHYRIDYRRFIHENIDLYKEIKSECAVDATLKYYCSNYNNYKNSYVKEDDEHFEKKEEIKAKIEESRERTTNAHPEKLSSTFDLFSDDDLSTTVRRSIMSGSAAITIVGIFYLFKFIPFGSWFNSLFGRKNKRGKNIDDVNNLPFSPMPMHGLINYDRREYNLLHSFE
ncbi:PIR protein [Plasmodium vivax]|nr:PIR protein [Plasmodium vivax]